MNIRSAANMPVRVSLDFDGVVSKTRQSMSKECDINNIMAGYQKRGAISHFSRHAPRYGFADSLEFHTAMNVVTEADRMFRDLPSTLRNRFADPGAFLDFVQDEANAEEMVELGLRDPVTARETPEARGEELPPAGEIVAPATSEAAVAAAEASD